MKHKKALIFIVIGGLCATLLFLLDQTGEVRLEGTYKLDEKALADKLKIDYRSEAIRMHAKAAPILSFGTKKAEVEWGNVKMAASYAVRGRKIFIFTSPKNQFYEITRDGRILTQDNYLLRKVN